VDTKSWEFYDLSCKSRDDTEDQVLKDAVAAGSRVGAIFKEPTITPTEEQKKKLGLKKVHIFLRVIFLPLCCFSVFFFLAAFKYILIPFQNKTKQSRMHFKIEIGLGKSKRCHETWLEWYHHQS
jgi:hypothetical protein